MTFDFSQNSEIGTGAAFHAKSYEKNWITFEFLGPHKFKIISIMTC